MGALNKWSRCMVGLELHRGGVVSKTIFEKRREFFFRGGGGGRGMDNSSSYSIPSASQSVSQSEGMR
jgi:hypothetical protein